MSDAPAAPSRADILSRLNAIVGAAHVLTTGSATRRYTRGYRLAAAQSWRSCAPARWSRCGGC